MDKTLAAANAIARRNRTPLQPLAPDAAPRTSAEGYRIQEALRDLLAADLGPLAGYKIGCTSAVKPLTAWSCWRPSIGPPTQFF